MRPDRLWKAGAAAFWLVVWQLAAMALGQKLLLASPLEVAQALAGLCASAIFWQSTAASLGRILAGFLLGAAAGCLLAAAAAALLPVRRLAAPLITVVRAVPVASFIILALLWVSSRALSTFVAFLMVLPVVYTGMLQGFDARDAQLTEMADLFRVRGARRLRYVTAPQLLPWAAGCFQTGIGLAFKSGVAAEVIGLPTGTIGERLYQTKLYLETGELFAWTLVIVLLSALCERLLAAALALLQRRLAA